MQEEETMNQEIQEQEATEEEAIASELETAKKAIADKKLAAFQQRSKRDYNSKAGQIHGDALSLGLPEGKLALVEYFLTHGSLDKAADIVTSAKAELSAFREWDNALTTYLQTKDPADYNRAELLKKKVGNVYKQPSGWSGI